MQTNDAESCHIKFPKKMIDEIQQEKSDKPESEVERSQW